MDSICFGLDYSKKSEPSIGQFNGCRCQLCFGILQGGEMLEFRIWLWIVCGYSGYCSILINYQILFLVATVSFKTFSRTLLKKYARSLWLRTPYYCKINGGKVYKYLYMKQELNPWSCTDHVVHSDAYQYFNLLLCYEKITFWRNISCYLICEG